MVVTYGAFLCYGFFDYGIDSPDLAIFTSPDGTKSAYLLWHGILMDRTLTFLTSNTSSLDDVIWIGNVDSDDDLKFNELLWSSDNTLVAARCFVTGYNKLPEGTKNNLLLTHGYDFESLDRLVPQRRVFKASSEQWISHDNKLKQLFTQKGGQQSIVSKDNLHNYMRKLKWGQWRQWRERLNKAKERQASTASTQPATPAQHEVVSTVQEFLKAIDSGDYNRAIKLCTPEEFNIERLISIKGDYKLKNVEIPEAYVGNKNSVVLASPVFTIERSKDRMHLGFSLVKSRNHWLIHRMYMHYYLNDAQDWLSDFKNIEPNAKRVAGSD